MNLKPLPDLLWETGLPNNRGNLLTIVDWESKMKESLANGDMKLHKMWYEILLPDE